MKNVMATAGLLAIGALGAQTVQAQFTAAGAEKPWSISGTLRGFYDDNYNTVSSDTGLKKGSFGYEVKPSISINVPLEQTTLTASYIYTLDYYEARPNNKIDQSHDFELYLNHNFSERYSVDLAESFVIAQEPEIIDPANSLPFRSNGNNIRNNAAINFHAQMTDLLGFVVGYANSWYKYSQDGDGGYASELNRWEHTFTLNTTWHVLPDTVAILGYQFGWVDHTSHYSLNPPGILPIIDPGARNQYTHNFYVGVNQTISRTLSANAKVGAQYLDEYNDSIQNGWGPFVQLSGNWQYMDGGTLQVGFNYTRNQTDETGQNLAPGGVLTLANLTVDQESATLYGTVIQQLTPKLTATVTGQYQNSTFEGGLANNDVDQLYLATLNLSYAFTHYLSSEVGYDYTRLQSEIPFRGYSRNQVYIGLTASY